MPELPEVETVKRILEPQLRGLSIKNASVNHAGVICRPSAGEFAAALAGQIIRGMARRGKFLQIHLESGDEIDLHLRMTGCLLVTAAEDPQDKHTHVVFHLENGKQLRFIDPRRFGRFWLIRSGEADTYSGIDRLGVEPFDENLSAAYLRENCGRRKKTIKECLLDQRFVAGIGNIYSDEILLAAAIYPGRPAYSLNGAEWERLAAAIPERLRYFVDKNDMEPEEYLRGRGKTYRNTPYFQVYGHAGDACPFCGNPLHKIIIGGRSSVYCPVCQENPGG